MTSPITTRQRLRRRTMLGATLLVVGCLLGIAMIGWLSVLTRPAALISTAWWPAAGVALGLGIRFPRRALPLLTLGVAAATSLLGALAGELTPLSATLSLVIGAEMAIGALILRGRRRAVPRLAEPSDLGRLVLAAVVSAVAFALLSAAVAAAFGASVDAIEYLLTGAPKHAAGMLLITPLFMSLPRRENVAGVWETVAQLVSALGTAVLVFRVNPDLPLAFLPFVPIVWAAMRLSTRALLIEMLGITVIASVGSATGEGPFSFARLGAGPASVMLQVFEISMVIVFLSLSLAVGTERDAERRTRELERAELARAGEVQRALLPEELPPMAGWSFAAVSAPAREVGGDFYDIRLRFPHAALCVGDVMGKGVAAGMLAAATRSALRAADVESAPGTAVAQTSSIVSPDLTRAGAFITLAYAVFDLRTGDFRLVDAGHGLHFVIRGETGAVERFASFDMPIGLDSAWNEVSDTLHPGDAILIVSDGVLDLWDGSVTRLEAAITSLAADAEALLPQAFLDGLCAGANETLDRDDVTALMLRREPLAA